MTDGFGEQCRTWFLSVVIEESRGISLGLKLRSLVALGATAFPIATHIPVFCPGFQKGRVPSEKGTLAR